MNDLSIFAFLIVGLLAGWIASRAMKKRYGLMMNLVVGIVGAYVGNVILRTFDFGAQGMAENIVSATLGAFVLLWLINALRRK